MNMMVAPPSAPMRNRIRHPEANVGTSARDERHHREPGVGRGCRPTGELAAQSRRRQLADVGGDRGDLGADAEAGDEPEHDQLGHVGAECSQDRAQGEHGHRDPQAQPPAPFVGDGRIGERTDDVTDQAAGDRQGDRRLGHVELRRNHRCGEGDRDDVEEGKEVTRADDPQELALVWPDRDAVKPRGDTGPVTPPPECRWCTSTAVRRCV
jgi:hypothetical protein